MEALRAEFLSTHASTYGGKGYTADEFDAMLAKEYPALSQTTYLDHLSSPPPPLSPLALLTTSLSRTLYSNPHSGSPSSEATDLLLSDTKKRVLKEIFGVDESNGGDEWGLVWTGGCTDSCSRVGEGFWRGRGEEEKGRRKFKYLRESHTSLVGIRGIAEEKGVEVEGMGMGSFLEWISPAPSTTSATSPPPPPPLDYSRTLFAYPAQCNTTSSLLSLSPIPLIKKKYPGIKVLLDAAAWVGTKKLNLAGVGEEEGPDFVVGSFYKIYGYSTGLGFLLIRLSSLPSLSPSYFGGGSITSLSLSPPYTHSPSSSCFSPSQKPSSSLSRPSPSAAVSLAHLQPGTPPFLQILALSHSLTVYQNLYGGLDGIEKHVKALAGVARTLLGKLRHGDGSEGVRIYGSFRGWGKRSTCLGGKGEGEREVEWGGGIGFTVLKPASLSFRSSPTTTTPTTKRKTSPETTTTKSAPTTPYQTPISHILFSTLATLNGFQLRSGGMCNKGVLCEVVGLSEEEVLELDRDLEEAAEGEGGRKKCWEGEEFFTTPSGELKPLGITRISFGASSTIDDVLKFVAFVKKFFLVNRRVERVVGCGEGVGLGVEGGKGEDGRGEGRAVLAGVVVYPIKSCGGQSIPSQEAWGITPTGLAYDREWLLANPTTGLTLSQKKIPKMALIRPEVCLGIGKLVVRAAGMKDLIIDLYDEEDEEEEERAKLCGEVVKVRSVGKGTDVDSWFEEFLGVSCRLKRCPSTPILGGGRHGHFDKSGGRPVPILLSNESPFLLISKESVGRVNEWISEGSEYSSDSSSDVSTSSSNTINETCFRANFILSSPIPIEPFFEDSISLLRIGKATFQVLARCRRCLMVCVNQDTGIKTTEPFSCLARERRNDRGRIEFGVHLMWRSDLSQGGNSVEVGVGDEVVFLEEEY